MRTCTACSKRRDDARFVGTRGKLCDLCRKKALKTRSRAKHLRETYDVSQAEYDGMLAAQNGVCAICEGARPYNLQVDHDHEWAERFGMRASIRGLLCKRCNKMLRDVHDDTKILFRAGHYVIFPPAKKVLFP